MVFIRHRNMVCIDCWWENGQNKKVSCSNTSPSFKRRSSTGLHHGGKKIKIIGVQVTCANIEVEGNQPKSPHYLIHLLTPSDPKLIDPVPLINGIRDAIAARAMRFFYIYEYIKFYQKTNCVVFRFGFTTIIASPLSKHLLSQAIERSRYV